MRTRHRLLRYLYLDLDNRMVWEVDWVCRGLCIKLRPIKRWREGRAHQDLGRRVVTGIKAGKEAFSLVSRIR
jgi:hypothetical protein